MLSSILEFLLILKIFGCPKAFIGETYYYYDYCYFKALCGRAAALIAEVSALARFLPSSVSKDLGSNLEL
jgi:hypothetical protein